MTVGNKFDQGKPRMDLLPPEALTAVADVLGYGAAKYAAQNWRQGIAHSRMVAALLRHLMAYQMGQNTDPESGLPHLAHMACNALMLLTSAQTGLGTDDRWTSTGDEDDTQQRADLRYNGCTELENGERPAETPGSDAEESGPRPVPFVVGLRESHRIGHLRRGT
jgi:hypothetical protein